MVRLKMFENSKKIAVDMFAVHLVWTLWFAMFVFLAQVIALIFADTADLLYFMDFGFNPSKTYMLVIGIISSYTFLKYYLHLGVTRKDYFIGSSAASVGLSIVMPVLFWILTGAQFVVFNIFSIPQPEKVVFGYDMISLMPFVIFAIHVLIYYLVGWMIGMSFYRFGVTGGFISIAGGLLGIFLLDALWGGRDAGNLILDMFSIQPFQFTVLTALVTSLALIIVIFMVHRLISKNVVVRTK